MGCLAPEILYGWEVCQCKICTSGPCEPKICQSWPIAAQTWSGPAHKGKNTWSSFLPESGRIPIAFFHSRIRTCSCPNPVVLFIVCPECALSWAVRDYQAKKSPVVEENAHSETRGTGTRCAAFHSANILINHHHKIQAVVEITECDGIREGWREKPANQGGSLLQGFP